MRPSFQRLPRALALALAYLPCLACDPGAPVSAGGIPDPGSGNQVDIDFANVPPNDTPDHATPLGTSTLANVTVWMGLNKIGGEGNEANYFVFRTAPTAGEFAFNGCFAKPITSLTARLSTVVDGREVSPPVGTWTSTKDDAGTGCLNDESAALEADSVYLFGITAQGGAGTYSL